MNWHWKLLLNVKSPSDVHSMSNPAHSTTHSFIMSCFSKIEMRLPIRKDSIIWLVGHQNQSFNNAKEQIVGYTQNDNQVMIVALNNND